MDEIYEEIKDTSKRIFYWINKKDEGDENEIIQNFMEIQYDLDDEKRNKELHKIYLETENKKLENENKKLRSKNKLQEEINIDLTTKIRTLKQTINENEKLEIQNNYRLNESMKEIENYNDVTEKKLIKKEKIINVQFNNREKIIILYEKL